MEPTFDTLCEKLVSSITTFYTDFDDDMNSLKMKNMMKVAKDINEYMTKENFVNVACNLVKDLLHDINLLYIFWTPNMHSDRMLKLLRDSDKLRLYMKGEFESLWDMEKEDQVNLGEKYPGLSL